MYHPKFIEVGEDRRRRVLTFANPPDSRNGWISSQVQGHVECRKIGSYGYYAYDAAMMLLECHHQSRYSARHGQGGRVLRAGQLERRHRRHHVRPEGDRKSPTSFGSSKTEVRTVLGSADSKNTFNLNVQDQAHARIFRENFREAFLFV